jgi:hypothetical protein
VALGLVATSCKRKPPQPGSACETEGTFVCDASGTSRVICHAKKYAFETCTACTQTSTGNGLTGKSTTSFVDGCTGRGTGPVGTACNNESFDCDGADFVRCAEGLGTKWERYHCAGAQGCQRVAHGVACDTSVAKIGDPCFSNNGVSCSIDLKEELRCKAGVWAHAITCGGPKACTSKFTDGKTTTVDCDTTFANVGDACKGDGGSCSIDKQSLLLCKDGKLVVDKVCRGGGECGVVAADTINCAHPGLAQVGDVCSGSSSACQADGKALLDCKGGAYASRMGCKSCTIVGEHLTCHH